MRMQDVMAEVEIVEARSEADHAAVRELCRAFRRWVSDRYPHQLDVLEAYYPADEFEALLAQLPEIHAPPKGAILIARVDGATAGCVMLSPLEDGACEMKRLFVVESARGKGVARALCGALFDAARAAGYRAMRLDTGPLHHEAQALYRSLGFRERAPYYDAPPLLRETLVFMERPL
jgi:ribosomal protein S18 acetylase RimI-like enzyme